MPELAYGWPCHYTWQLLRIFGNELYQKPLFDRKFKYIFLFLLFQSINSIDLTDYVCKVICLAAGQNFLITLTQICDQTGIFQTGIFPDKMKITKVIPVYPAKWQ